MTTRTKALCCWLILGSSACSGAKVQSVTVDPPSVCPGDSVTVSWVARGNTTVSATPTPLEGWVDGPACSEETRKGVKVAATTKFQVTTPDANQANGDRAGVAEATVPSPERVASAPCDAGNKNFVGAFTVESSASLRVTGITAPIFVRSGKQTPRRICVSHDGKDACVDPGASVPFDAAAAGKWTLTSTLSADEGCTPPPKLELKLLFACRARQ